MVGIDRLDATLNFVIGGGTDHGGVVAGVFKFREEKREVGKGGIGFFAEDLIGTDAASEDDGLSIGMCSAGGLEFF